MYTLSRIWAVYSGEIETLKGEAEYITKALYGTEACRCLNKRIPTMPHKLFWVYVIQSQQTRENGKPGFFYVGMTNNPARRLRAHNGVYVNGSSGFKGGGHYTSKFRPWVGKALYGPYFSPSEALRAEYALKRQKRGVGRLQWSPQNSPLCRGAGINHEWVSNPTNWKPPTPEEYQKQQTKSVVLPT